MIASIYTDKAPQPIGPYSQATIVNGFVFCSGQVGVEPITKTLAEGIEAQIRQLMKNLQEVLLAAGSDFEHVVKATIYLVNRDDFSQVNKVYASYFSENKPARATVEVSKLPKGSMLHEPLVEIELIAVKK